jgi:hypothetical protein
MENRNPDKNQTITFVLLVLLVSSVAAVSFTSRQKTAGDSLEHYQKRHLFDTDVEKIADLRVSIRRHSQARLGLFVAALAAILVFVNADRIVTTYISENAQPLRELHRFGIAATAYFIIAAGYSNFTPLDLHREAVYRAESLLKKQQLRSATERLDDCMISIDSGVTTVMNQYDFLKGVLKSQKKCLDWATGDASTEFMRELRGSRSLSTYYALARKLALATKNKREFCYDKYESIEITNDSLGYELAVMIGFVRGVSTSEILQEFQGLIEKQP